MRFVCPECGDSGEAGSCPADGTTRASAGNDALLGTTIGSWRVARLLGAGGMGKVYVAVQPKIGARVAIKVLRRESADDAHVVERFFNEARAVNLIKHEAIVDVIDLGRLADGEPYIVMEYLDGASLGAVVRRLKQLPLGTLARIVGDVLAALEATHAKSIIHRDLKPDNIFISPGGRVTVLDFGIAKLAPEGGGFGSTKTGSLLGTPAYMSPEQARTQPLDARSDLYSIGVILYEAATGQLPFIAQNLFDLLEMHIDKPPRPPRELEPEMPAAYEAVILRALAKEPADRFASATAMRDALVAAAAGLPQPSLSIVAEAPGKEKQSDPLAETAASESIATDKTLPSSPPQPAPVPRAKQPARLAITRTTLVALLAGVALLGVGVAFLLIDNAKPSRASYADKDAGTNTVHADAEPSQIAIPNQEAIPIANPKALDPMATYAAAERRALQLGGPKTRLYSMVIRDADAHGMIDLATGGLAIIFASSELAKTGQPCYLQFDYDASGGRFSAGRPENEDHCDDGINPPRCPLATVIQQAHAKGLPADANDLTFQRFPDNWLVSAGDWNEGIDDDCP